MKANKLFATCSAVALAFSWTSAFAADGAAETRPEAPDEDARTATSAGLEEIIVTARKRSENLQDVPVAVSSLSGDALTKQGARTVSDLTRMVPSLNVQTETAQAGAAAAIFELRGQVASDSVLEISQAVGLYLDGVNIPHPGGSNLGFFDIARVDVLKGPQGTLYGRNTTGGAVNITTRGADFDGIHGYAEGEVGNYNNFRMAGAVNLPLVENVLALRFATQRWYRDGFGKSVVTGQRMGDDRNDWTSRLSLLFTPGDKFRADIRVEYDKADRHGRLEQPAFNTIGAAGISAGAESGVPLVYATNFSEFCGSLPFTCASVGAAAAAGNAAIDSYVNNPNRLINYQDGLSDERIRQWHGSAILTYDFSDAVQLKSITGVHHTSIYKTYDLDGTPFQLVGVNLPSIVGIQPPIKFQPDVRYTQWTQEFNLSGKALDGRLSWLLGTFYSHDKGDAGTYHIAVTSLIDNINSALNGVFGTNNVGYTTSAGAFDQLDVTSKTWAIFSQNDFRITDELSLTGGLRYTEEKLSHNQVSYSYYFNNGIFDCLQNPGVPVPGPAACGTYEEKKYSSVSYLGSINYRVTPDVLVYLKTSRGNRAGALQPRAPASIAPPAEPETATDYEIGVKGEYFDRRLRLNLAAFRTNYKNLQATTIVANVNNPTSPWLIVTNAGKARFEGFEAEFNALPVEGWSIYGSLSYLKGKYLDYPNAVTPSNTIVDGTGLDITDQQNSHPRWRYSIGSRYEHEVGPGILGAQLDWAWHSRGMLNATNMDVAVGDPSVLAPYIEKQKELRRAIGIMNGRIDYRLPDQDLTFSLFATNLLDKRYEVVGTLGSAIVGVTTSIVQPPRMVGFSISKKFGGG